MTQRRRAYAAGGVRRFRSDIWLCLWLLGSCKGGGLATHLSADHRSAAAVCDEHYGPVYPSYHPSCATDADCQNSNGRCVSDGNALSCSDPLCSSDADCFSSLTRCVQNGNVKTCSEVVACQQDSDCVASPLGCMSDGNSRKCVVDTCVQDTDCGEKGVCACNQTSLFTATPINYCTHGNCQTDSDCPKGVSCSPSPTELGYDTAGFFCHTADDACNTVDDCPSPRPGEHEICYFDASKKSWQCLGSNAEE